MTLLEVLAALVIVGTSAAGFLELFQGVSRASRDARDWTRAAAIAASTMEETKLDAAGLAPAEPAELPAGFAREVRETPRGDGLREILVTVRIPGGAAYELRRLERAP